MIEQGGGISPRLRCVGIPPPLIPPHKGEGDDCNFRVEQLCDSLNPVPRIAAASAKSAPQFQTRVMPASTGIAPGDQMKVAIDMGMSGGTTPATLDLEELLATRLLVQGNSGSGKSHLLRRLLEQSAPWVHQCIIDPDGDFNTLS